MIEEQHKIQAQIRGLEFVPNEHQTKLKPVKMEQTDEPMNLQDIFDAEINAIPVECTCELCFFIKESADQSVIYEAKSWMQKMMPNCSFDKRIVMDHEEGHGKRTYDTKCHATQERLRNYETQKYKDHIEEVRRLKPVKIQLNTNTNQNLLASVGTIDTDVESILSFDASSIDVSTLNSVKPVSQ